MQTFDGKAYDEKKSELQGKLQKLEKNIRQMTPEQKVKYKRALEKLKSEIAACWSQLLNLSETRVVMPVNATDAETVQKLWKESYKGKIRDFLYEEFNLDAALELAEAFKLEVVANYNGFYSVLATEAECKELETSKR